MECLNTLWGFCFLHDLSEPQDATVFDAASESLAFSYENIFHNSLAAIGGFTLPTEPVVHSKPWRYRHANPVAFGCGYKGRPMLTRKNNDPMARHAVGFHVYWRDSP